MAKQQSSTRRAAAAAHPARGKSLNPLQCLEEAQRLLATGQCDAAEPLLASLLALPLVGPEAHYLLAISSILSGRAAEAVDRALRAVEGQPGDARYHFTLGRAYKAAANLEAAEAAYRQALELQPGYVDAMVSLGIVLKTRGDVDGAIALYDRALRRNPAFAPAHANRSAALALRAELAAEAGADVDPDDPAIEAQARAAQLDPSNPVLQRNLGVLLMRARRRKEAAGALNLALSLDPSSVETCLNLAFCLRALGDYQLAGAVYEKWLGLNPPNAVVMRSLAAVRTRDGQVDEARRWAERAAEIDLDAHALAQLGSTLMQSRRLEESLDHCRRAIELSGGLLSLYPTWLLGLNYLHEDPQPIFEAHAEFGRRLPKSTEPRPRWQPLQPGERLKVGYVSGDFVRHSVSYFIGALLEHHDTRRFDVTCYNNLGWGDSTTARLKSYGHRWVECEGLTDDQLRRRIQADGIHLLIDLAGHTSHSRVSMFGLGVAPVQLTYLGYPTVNGVAANDFRITDAVIDPLPSDQPAHPAEQPLRLTRSMFCYRPDEHPPVAPPPSLQAGFVTFGSFNNIAKVSDHTLELWAAAMNAVPDSRLLLKSAAMAQTSNRENIERFLGERGIAADRLSLQPWTAGKSTHLEMYNAVDLALDPFPYNGATTTCEALWMGVPVVTRCGRTHTSRMGASILCSVGRHDWIAHSDEAYVETVARVATNAEGRAHWRLAARSELAHSELFDEHGFIRAFEAQLEAAWATAGERCSSATPRV